MHARSGLPSIRARPCTASSLLGPRYATTSPLPRPRVDRLQPADGTVRRPAHGRAYRIRRHLRNAGMLLQIAGSPADGIRIFNFLARDLAYRAAGRPEESLLRIAGVTYCLGTGAARSSL